MADKDSGQITGQNKSTSPWDDDLEIDENARDKNNPDVIGSFEPAELPQKPVPFNVPEEVVEEKVAKTIPAEEVMGNSKPVQYQNQQNIETKSVAPQNNIAPKQENFNGNASQNINNLNPGRDNLSHTQAQNPVVNGGVNELIKEKSQGDLLENQPKAWSAPQNLPPKPVTEPPRNEYTQLEYQDPVLADSPTAFPPLTPQKQISEEKVVSDTGVETENNAETSDDPFAQPFVFKPDNQDTLIQNQANENTLVSGVNEGEGSSGNLNQVSNSQEVASNILDKESPPKAPETQMPKKTSLFGRFFTKKTKPQKVGSMVPNSYQTLPVRNQALPGSLPLSQAKKMGALNKLFIAAGFILILVSTVYLTEMGLLSLGVEKIYGMVALEQLWGGLPKNPDKALFMAFAKLSESPEFKFSGAINTTVDKTKDSPVSSPLISMIDPVLDNKDTQIALSQNAKFTQSYEYYDYYGSSVDTSTSSSASNSTNSDYQDSDGSLDSSIPKDQSSQSSYTPSEQTIKQLEFNIEGQSSKQAISGTFEMIPLVGTSKTIEVLNSNGKLYLKSEQIKYNPKWQSGKWLEYGFNGLGLGNNLLDFSGIKEGSGLSVSGKRVANEKIRGVRSYKYQIDDLEIAEALAPLGIPSESISKISGTVWIGVKSHLPTKINLEIVPNVTAAFTKIEIDIELFAYNISNQINVPTASEVITVSDIATAANQDVNTDSQAPASPDPAAAATDNSASDATRDNTRKNDLDNIKSALINYKASNGRYPNASVYENISSANSVAYKALVPKYLSSMPSDPMAASGYWYGYKSDGSTFTLSARFENINSGGVSCNAGVCLYLLNSN